MENPVQKRLLAPLIIVVVVLLGGFYTARIRMQEQDLHNQITRDIEEIPRKFTRLIETQADGLSAAIEVIADGINRQRAFVDRDMEYLLETYTPLFNTLLAENGITHFYFHLPDRTNLLRIHKPEKRGDVITRFTAREAEETGEKSVGIELGPLGTFTLRVVKPVYIRETMVGFLELGKEIEEVLAALHERRDIELAVSIHKKMLERSQWEAGMAMLNRQAQWDRFEENVLIWLVTQI
jgi:hypothetical protein